MQQSFLLASLGAALVVSLLSVVIVLLFFWKTKEGSNRLFYLLCLSAGGMLGGALFHLLPEAVALAEESLMPYVLTLAGFCLFFVVEKAIHWHHCHRNNCPDHERLGYINLFGDALHNFLDGIIIVSSFAISIPLGIAVTLAVIFHEVPQEIGDFGVLLYAGFTKMRALWFNFLVALSAIVGVFVGYLLLVVNVSVESYLVPIAAGSFLYIASTDLIPEIHKEERLSKSALGFVIFLTATTLMYFLKVYAE